MPLITKMATTFNKYQDITSKTKVVGVSLGGSVRVKNNANIYGTLALKTGTTVNDLSIDGTFADNSDNSLVTEKAIKTYVDTAVGVEDLWDRDSTNSYTYLKNADNVGIGTASPDTKLTISQSADDEGINIYGYDDKSSEKLSLSVDSSGNSVLNTTENMYFKRSGSTYLIMQSGNLRFQDDIEAVFGSGNDYAIGYNSSDDTFNIVDGYDVSANRRLVINSSGNVGIGTTSPSQPLHIVSSGNGGLEIDNSSGAPTIIFDIPSNEQARLYFQEDDTVLGSIIYETSGTPDAIAFKAGSNTERMRILDTGNVGIGTTTPGEKLQVTGKVLITTDSGSDASIRFEEDGGSPWIIGAKGSGDADFVIAQTNSNLSTNPFVTIDKDDGKVGIGTTSPNQKLEVKDGNINIQNDDGGFLTFENGSANITIHHNDSGTEGRDLSFTTWKSGVGNTEKMRIDKDGNVGIGQDNYDPMIQPSSGSSAGNVGYSFKADTDTGFSSGASSNTCAIVTAGSYRTYWDASGNVGIGTTSPETKMHIQNGSAGTIATVDGAVLTLESNEKPKIHFQSPNAYGGSIVFGSVADSDEGQIDYDSGSDRFLFKTGGTTKMAILGDNVGIGTTSPSEKLDIASGHILLSDSYRLKWGSTSYVTADTSNLILRAADGDNIRFKTDSAGTTRMIILDDGKVGIGTESPSYTLTVEGQSEFENSSTDDVILAKVTTDSVHRFAINTSGQMTWGAGGSDSRDTNLYRDSANKLRTADTFIVDGNVGIGTTSPNDTLSVAGTAYADGGAGTGNTVFGYDAGTQLASGDNYNVFIGHQVADADMTNATNNVGVGYQALTSLTEGDNNTIMGYQAGQSLLTGDNNTAIGNSAMGSANGSEGRNVAVGYNSLGALNSDGDNYNVAVGYKAGYGITTGARNVAIGYQTLNGTTTQTGTVAIGNQALEALTSGATNTAIGYKSQNVITVGAKNTSLGYEALVLDVGGSRTTAIGESAARQQDGGDSATNMDNVAVGHAALFYNINGTNNVAIGQGAAYGASSQSHSNNIAIGKSSLGVITTGGNNTAIGSSAGTALTTGTYNVAIGSNSLETVTTGTNNTVLGFQALRTSTTGANNNTVLGYSAGRSPSGSFDADKTVIIGSLAMYSGVTTSAADGTVAIGYESLKALTTGASNVAIGYQAGLALVDGGTNTLLGYQAGASLVDNDSNTAVGHLALSSANSGEIGNVCIGYRAGLNIDGTGADLNVIIGKDAGLGGGGNLASNVVIGANALSSTGTANVSKTIIIGEDAGTAINNTGADGTVAIGHQTLTALTTGANNVAIGYQSGLTLADGGYSTLLGYQAGVNITSGSNNVAIGWKAMDAIQTGGRNTAVGTNSLGALNTTNTEAYNVAFGQNAGSSITSGTHNTIIGSASDPSAVGGTNQTVVGYATTGQADNSVTLGNASVTAVYMAQDKGATVHCGDINVQYEYIHVGFNYAESAGTFCAIPLRAGTRPFTTFVGNLEKACMIAPHGGTLEVINFRSEEVGGNPVVIGFHKATNGTEVPSDTPTVSTSVDMSGVADDTTTAFAFSLSNSFNRGDVLGFSIDPANDVNDCLMVITLKYDTTT